MSYARLSANSDVYVFASSVDPRGVPDHLECCWCALGPTFVARGPEEMFWHLVQHEVVGHKVPPSALLRLCMETPGCQEVGRPLYDRIEAQMQRELAQDISMVNELVAMTDAGQQVAFLLRTYPDLDNQFVQRAELAFPLSAPDDHVQASGVDVSLAMGPNGEITTSLRLRGAFVVDPEDVEEAPESVEGQA